jgi:predicted phosphodiesterase
MYIKALMPKFQIISDTHLEFRGLNFRNLIKPSAPVLFLLGDICVCGTTSDWYVYKKFIEFLSPQFQYIFHIPGNHEYYTTNRNITLSDTIPGINTKLKKFARTIKNFAVLNNNTDRIVLEKKTYVIIGATLWTCVDPENQRYIESRMNDYSMCWMPNEPPKTEIEKAKWKPYRHFNIKDMTKFHNNSVRYITNVVKKLKTGEIPILLTHHKPVHTNLDPGKLIQAYETDLTKSIIKHPLKIACHGHTHKHMDKIINGVRILSNPKGYIHESTKHDPSFVFTI